MATSQRKYTAQFKARVVLEVLQGEKSPADACRTYKLYNSVLTRWKREFLERSHHVFEVPTQVGQEEGKVVELERMVGQLTMQLEIARKASKLLSGSENVSW